MIIYCLIFMLIQNKLFVSNYCIETILKYSLMKYLFFISLKLRGIQIAYIL